MDEGWMGTGVHPEVGPPRDEAFSSRVQRSGLDVDLEGVLLHEAQRLRLVEAHLDVL